MLQRSGKVVIHILGTVDTEIKVRYMLSSGACRLVSGDRHVDDMLKGL